ncbi:hypothetical protein I4U23_003622 [Adineta vaga]|nr:hypothetical protein I4U23_003622 [Adineta vaga]
MMNEIESKYSIYFLSQKPEYIEEMAKIFYNEWQDSYHASGLHDLEAVIQDMKDDHALNENKLPLLMLALDNQNQNLVATIGLEICDVSPGNPYYNTTPWVACTFTKPEYRGQGIAKYMTQKLLEHTRQLNYTHLWLWTRTAEGFFEKLGFHFVEKLRHGQSDITVMRIDFDTSNY